MNLARRRYKVIDPVTSHFGSHDVTFSEDARDVLGCVQYKMSLRTHYHLVCVCVCVCERERERERVCECVCV